MQQFLYQYDVNPTTWVYLSSLLIVAIYFKFNRFWSIRNLDLLGLLALAPGILMLAYRGGETGNTTSPIDAAQDNPTLKEQGNSSDANPSSRRDGSDSRGSADSGTSVKDVQRWGFLLLFGVGFLFLVRLLIDTMLVRRPLLEPNLAPGGLAFLGIALFVFLMTNVLSAPFPEKDDQQALAANLGKSEPVVNGSSLAAGHLEPHLQAVESHPVLRNLPSVPSRAFDNSTISGHGNWRIPARIMIVLAHLIVVLGLLAVGLRHFGNLGTGVAMSSLYLLLPYTAQLVGRVEHVLPPALFVLSVVAYRRPAIAGFLLTSCLAVMLCPLPLFLFPLWASFYWQRGLGRFTAGVGCGVIFLAVVLLALEGLETFWSGAAVLLGSATFGVENASGFWTQSSWIWRIPVGALFLVVSLAMAIWPAQKNLGTLIACSAVVMLGAQFWYPFNGMMYVHWYLPLALLTIFRPNLENRIAIASLGRPRWMRKQEMTPQAA
ncbi:MAG: hypothetical protein MPJ50_12400 [Pirellulales bacterium]|nr:hypothetical protein [Pirellulales bacterium]